MDPRFLGYYERELKHVREMGGEFAREFPKIAERLGLDSFECADPYVERLIESFAFLTARVQLKLDGAYPQFTQQMLELLYPGFLAPTPSMAVVQLQPNAREGALTNGILVPRGASLRSRLGQGQTACEYRTAHPVTLFPIEIVSADYRGAPGELLDLERVQVPTAKAALRIVLRTLGGRTFDQLRLDSLPLFLRGGHEVAPRLYEHLVSSNIGMVLQSATRPVSFCEVVRTKSVEALGFDDDHALLPCGERGFHGQRLLQEYFAFPERYLFVSLQGLAAGLRSCKSDQVELTLLFNRVEPRLDGLVKRDHMALFCTPAINLFPRQVDRLHLSERDHEYHVVPDRTRPTDFEVHSLTQVVGHGAELGKPREFHPMYGGSEAASAGSAHYTVRRQQRLTRTRERDTGARHHYVPSETFVSVVDGAHGPFDPKVQQLAISTLCTNRALPLQMSVGKGETDFTEQSGAPVESVRCVAGPTPPRASPVHGDLAWHLLSHLSLDYLSILRSGTGQHAVRDLLSLYVDFGDRSLRPQVMGVTSVDAATVVRPLPFPGPMSFGRGVELTLTCDEQAFEGTGVFVLASVLERFFAKYASINSFAQTVLRTTQRGEVMRWPTTAGRRQIL
ncbi:MAG: type secretion protein [Myxococcaceae bacterium]|nr:type secretion protein [Myxococcaceae bacterium]